jgi:CheY-like chemotaxis protein
MSFSSPRTSLAAKLTVLLADPSREVREGMELAARASLPGANVQAVATGTEALGILRSTHVDALIIDVAMPGMTAPDVVLEARKENKRPFLILTSALVLPNWAMMATELSAYEYLKKPFLMEDIEGLLRTYGRMREPTRLLIADAGDTTRAMVRKVVSASRFEVDVHETDNGGHALKLARIQPFDAVLIDSNLNGINGLETACQLQSLHPDLTVVSMLPSNDGGLGQSLKHMGLNHFLRKPFFTRDIDMLLHSVHNLRRPYLMNAVMKAAATALAG